MKDYINEIAYMIAEASEEVSFNDINVILKKLGKERSEFTLDRDAYEKLPDDMKEEIHMYAQKNLSDEDEIDMAQASTIDTDKVLKWLDDEDRRMHHIDSEGFYRDNEGRQTITTAMANVMKKNGTLDDFLKKGGVVKRKGMSDYSYDTKYFLFVVEKVDKFLDEKVTYTYMNDKGEEEEDEVQKRKPILKKIGTLKFDTKEQALKQLDIRLKNISNKYKITKDMFKESVPPQIQKVDPDAQGMIFLKTVGENGRVLKHRGPQSKNQDSRAEEIVYDKLTYSYFFEYVVYKSNEIAKDNGNDMMNYLKKTYGKQ